MTQNLRLRRNMSRKFDLATLASGRRPRRLAALRLERDGLVTIGAHDEPIRITQRGKEAIRALVRQYAERT